MPYLCNNRTNKMFIFAALQGNNPSNVSSKGHKIIKNVKKNKNNNKSLIKEEIN